MSKRIYLAGPEVFLPNVHDIAREKKQICTESGFEGVFPLDAELRLKGLSPREAGLAISRKNEELMRASDLVIANMTPFRYPGRDVGTAYEMGIMRGLGKPVVGYTNVEGSLLERTVQILNGDVRERRGGAGLEDSEGMLIEDFELIDNLMLDGAVLSRGTEVVVVRTPPSRRFSDLQGFEICVQQAAKLVSCWPRFAPLSRSTRSNAPVVSIS